MKNKFTISNFMKGFIPVILAGGVSLFAYDSFSNRGNLTQKLNEPVAQVQRDKNIEERDYKIKNFSKDSEEVLFARMLFGEARNCSDEEIIAVGYTAVNRTKDGRNWNGEGSIKEVLLSPKQYSCFNDDKYNQKNLEAMRNPMKYDSVNFERALKISREILSGKYRNPIDNATLYDLKGCNPKWLKSNKVTETTQVQGSKHKFYKEIN